LADATAIPLLAHVLRLGLPLQRLEDVVVDGDLPGDDRRAEVALIFILVVVRVDLRPLLTVDEQLAVNLGVHLFVGRLDELPETSPEDILLDWYQHLTLFPLSYPLVHSR